VPWIIARHPFASQPPPRSRTGPDRPRGEGPSAAQDLHDHGVASAEISSTPTSRHSGHAFRTARSLTAARPNRLRRRFRPISSTRYWRKCASAMST